MAKPKLNLEQQNLLKIIHEYILQNDGEIPHDAWLASEMNLKQTEMWGRLDRLEKKGYVTRDYSRTGLDEKAFKFFSSITNDEKVISPLSTIPAQVRVIGQVKAGRTSPDILEFDQHSHKTIAIPNVKYERQTFAYEVVGNSMISEDIHEGDYVIVEEFLRDIAEKPNIGELIVTRYIPYHMKDQIGIRQFDEDDYLGPTLKRYYTRQIGHQEYIELGWLGGSSGKGEKLNAIDISPIGRVIGLFRDLR